MHKWGYELRPGEERFSWIKLLLKPEGYLASGSDIKYLIPTPSTKKPIDLIADYLRCLREHTLATIKRRYGAAFLKATPIDYILTVPAVRMFTLSPEIFRTDVFVIAGDLDRFCKIVDSPSSRVSRFRE